MKFNLKNPSDFERAIQLLQLANVELSFLSTSVAPKEAVVTINHIYNYDCPHCDEEYVHSEEEFSSCYDQKTGLLTCIGGVRTCGCGKKIKPMFKYCETSVPQVKKSDDCEEEVYRIKFEHEKDRDKILKLLNLAGIETYDLGEIEQAVIYTTHCYSYDCPKCGVHHSHDAYGDFEDVYDANHQRVTCSQCQETFRVVFQNAKSVVFEG